MHLNALAIYLHASLHASASASDMRKACDYILRCSHDDDEDGPLVVRSLRSFPARERVSRVSVYTQTIDRVPAMPLACH